MKPILRTMSCALLVAVLALAFVGCTETGESTTPQGDGEVTEQELIERAVSAQEGVETSQFDMEMATGMKGEASQEKADINMAYNMSGKVDRANKRMQITADITMDVPLQEGASQPVKAVMMIYSLEDMMYMKVGGLGMPDQWTKTKIPEGYWEERINQQIELLQESRIEISGEGKVGGLDCYAVDFVPSKEKMWEIIQQQWPGQTTQDKPSNLDEVIQSMALKQWIDKETFLPVKEETQITMGVSPENVQAPASGAEAVSMTMDIVATYHSYNEPVSIELPPEAQNATETQTAE